ncbi:MAG: hypothetical protein F4213_07365 [Boseongicola sp. SB0677_bin_26]|nr:hypothetical protein [Boseongicola sp. SB0665_bin_10]MYG25830.1 hypothetical protein [Boseongicola sp. SB0677_bin_26]
MSAGSGVIDGWSGSVTCGCVDEGGAGWPFNGTDRKHDARLDLCLRLIRPKENFITALRCCSLNNRMTDMMEWRLAA